MAGQSLSDRIVAAQHSLVGSDMSKTICKASTTELTAPKKKHLDYLLRLTHEPNINIPDMANVLVDRSRQMKWVVVFKSLVTTHHLMSFGNEKFLQHMASRNTMFSLEHFLDKTGGPSYDMSPYIRRYSRYLNQKALAYRTVAFDFTRIERGKDGFFRSLDVDKLLKALPVLQQLLDALLEFDAKSHILSNPIVNSAFTLLFKDLIRLFACYNDGIINLLEKFFNMKKSQCKDALELYRNFVDRMAKVSVMLKVAEEVGIDKGDIPELSNAPSSLLESLQQHYDSLDDKKNQRKNVISKNLSPSSINNNNSFFPETKENIFYDESYKAKETEESKHFDDFQNYMKNLSPTSTNPPLPLKSTMHSTDLLDIFGGTAAFVPTTSTTSASSNILQTSTFTSNNPFSPNASFAFTENVSSFQPNSTTANESLFLPSSVSNDLSKNLTLQAIDLNLNEVDSAKNPSLIEFSSINKSKDTGNALDLTSSFPISNNMTSGSFADATFNMPSNPTQLNDQKPAGSQNLESSLASNFASLSLLGQKNGRKLEPKTEKKLTGGANYNPMITPGTTTVTSYPMMNRGMSMYQSQALPIFNQNTTGSIMTSQQQPLQQQQLLQQQPLQQQEQLQQQQQMHLGMPSHENQSTNHSMSPNNPFNFM